MPIQTDAALRLAAAQSISLPCDVRANVATHVRFATAAHDAGADIVVFPELSLSGYELEHLADCIVDPASDVVDPLRRVAREASLTIVAGAPLAPVATARRPAIGAIAFLPDGGVTLYRKQHLHGVESDFADAGERRCDLHRLGDERYALAICADITHPEHAEAAAGVGASLYLAGALITDGGYGEDAAHVRDRAARLSLGVLLANYGGPSGPYTSAGRSAFWAPGGELVVAADGAGSCLVIAERRDGRWRGSVAAV